MNQDQAKHFLGSCRPRGQDQQDPLFAEAARHLETDPALAEAFAEQRKFDTALTRAVQGIPVPEGLKESILASRKTIQLVPWWKQPVPAAAAALFLFLLTVGAVWSASKPKSFADYRNQVVEESWSISPHLDLETSDLQKVQRWMAQQHGMEEFVVPAGLRDLPVRGCRNLDCDGHKVAVLCFQDGTRHAHLFVMNRMEFADLAALGGPEFEKCHGWKTASWSQGEATYILVGMKYQAFIKRFRKAGQWNMAG